MNYFIVRDYEGNEELYESEVKVEYGDYVVIPDYDDRPVTGKVVKLVNRFKALTSNTQPQRLIDIVDMKRWKLEREKEMNDNILLAKMHEQIANIQLEEKLEKYAGKNPKMLELYKQYQQDINVDEQTYEDKVTVTKINEE